MIRITSQTKVQIASPDQSWSLLPGANHFESDLPETVAVRLAKLQADGVVTVDVIDGDHVRPWQPAKVTAS